MGKPRKWRERFFLKRFLEAKQLPAAIERETEAPDFEVSLNGRRLGVEVSELFRDPGDGNSRQAQEACAEKIALAARQKYEAAGGPHLHVSIYFAPNVDLTRIRRDALAERLAALVWQLPLDPRGPTRWRNPFRDRDLDALASLLVLPVSDRTKAYWGPPFSDWIAPLTVDIITSAVDRKAQRLPTYRARFPEVWLLLVAYGNRPSSFFSRKRVPDFASIQTPFNHAYYFHYSDSYVVPLGRND
jgi:hypothetical protein